MSVTPSSRLQWTVTRAGCHHADNLFNRMVDSFGLGPSCQDNRDAQNSGVITMRHNDASQYGCSTTAFSFRPQRPAAAQLPIFHFIGTTAARIAAKQRFVSAVQHEAGEERGVCHLIRRPLTAGSTCQFGKVGHFSSGFVCHALRKHMRPTGCCQHALSRTHKRHTRAHTHQQTTKVCSGQHFNCRR